MKLTPLQFIGLAGIATLVYKVVTQESASGSLMEKVENLGEDIQNTLSPGAWSTSAKAQTYVPTLLQIERDLGIPEYLLARVAYQESHFRDDIVSGALRSPAGAIGLMQLMPQFFPGAGADWQADARTAGNYLVQLYLRFNDWQAALGAYNWGPGNLSSFLAGKKTMPTETKNYISQIVADTAIPGAFVNV